MKSQARLRIWAVSAVIGALAFASCGPRQSPALDRAEQAYRAAANDPTVTQNAAVALRDAEQSLDEARDALSAGRDLDVVEHHAYVAEQKVAIARATARLEEAKHLTEALNERRDDVIIQARTEQAARAQARAQQLEIELENAKRTDRGLVLTLGDVLFETGRAELKPGAMNNLYNLITFLREHPDRGVVIEGHTDDVGSDTYNQQLSQQRAEAVRSFLASNGVDTARIQARGLGEALPVTANTTEAGRQQNRRVEVVILDSGTDASAEAAPSGGSVTIPIR
jgi:OmpA-OmpF porin, OOP family